MIKTTLKGIKENGEKVEITFHSDVSNYVSIETSSENYSHTYSVSDWKELTSAISESFNKEAEKSFNQ